MKLVHGDGVWCSSISVALCGLLIDASEGVPRGSSDVAWGGKVRLRNESGLSQVSIRHIQLDDMIDMAHTLTLGL